MVILAINHYGINISLILITNISLTLYYSKKYNNLNIKWLLASSSSIQYLLIALLIDDFQFLLFLIVVTPFINFIGFLISYNKNLITFLRLGLMFGLILYLCFFIGKPISDNVVIKRTQIPNKKYPEITLVEENGNPYSMEKNQLYVLNFWSLSCGICIKKMPDYNNLVKKFPEIKFASVLYARNQEEIESSKKFTNPYDFDKVVLKDYNQFKDSIKNPGFPYFMIVKNKELIYNGLPKYKTDYLNKNLVDLVKEAQKNY